MAAAGLLGDALSLVFVLNVQAALQLAVGAVAYSGLRSVLQQCPTPVAMFHYVTRWVFQGLKPSSPVSARLGQGRYAVRGGCTAGWLIGDGGKRRRGALRVVRPLSTGSIWLVVR